MANYILKYVKKGIFKITDGTNDKNVIVRYKEKRLPSIKEQSVEENYEEEISLSIEPNEGVGSIDNDGNVVDTCDLFIPTTINEIIGATKNGSDFNTCEVLPSNGVLYLEPNGVLLQKGTNTLKVPLGVLTSGTNIKVVIKGITML